MIENTDMVKIEDYRVPFLERCGAAHWSTICVLAYITAHYSNPLHKTYKGYDGKKKLYEAEIRVSRYDGCREQGFVFSLLYKGHQANFAIFNPCQYDALCLMMDDKVTDHPDGWGDREWDKHAKHDKEFDYEQCLVCAEYILDRMERLVNEWV